jgi:transposase
MVFDAHDRAFAFYRGACVRGIYDNMKTAVETVFVGKDRAFNRRFLRLCSHYLVEPTGCTPGAGWEKGQVENQIRLVRERFFTPRLRFRTYEEMNGRPSSPGPTSRTLRWRHNHPIAGIAQPIALSVNL